MGSLQQLSSISKLLTSSNLKKSDVYAHHIHSFRKVWDRTDVRFKMKHLSDLSQFFPALGAVARCRRPVCQSRQRSTNGGILRPPGRTPSPARGQVPARVRGACRTLDCRSSLSREERGT